MLLLTTTSDFLQIVTGNALSTDIVASYVDITTTTFTPGSQQTNTTTATTTTIVAAPAASTQRQIKMISVTNKGASAQVVTIQKSSTTVYNVTGGITLQTGEVLYYQDGIGFSVRDINGQIKETNATVASLSSTLIGYGSSSNAITGSSNFTYGTTGTLTLAAATSGPTASIGGSTSIAGATLITGASTTGITSTAGLEFYYSGGGGIQSINGSSGYTPLSFNASQYAVTVGASQLALSIASAGNVTIAAPTSGNALTVSGTANASLFNTLTGSFTGAANTTTTYVVPTTGFTSPAVYLVTVNGASANIVVNLVGIVTNGSTNIAPAVTTLQSAAYAGAYTQTLTLQTLSNTGNFAYTGAFPQFQFVFTTNSPNTTPLTWTATRIA